MNWLHFVGKAYYTIRGFEQEAERLGVSRRASSRMLGGFSWGDRIYLAQGDMRQRTRKTPFLGSIVFGMFEIVSIGGINPDVLDTLETEVQDLGLRKLNLPDRGREKRYSGEYTPVAQYRVNSSIQWLAYYFREFDNPGDLLLQGTYTPLRPRVVLPEVSFRWGFRRFDGVRFLESQQAQQDQEHITLPGETFEFDRPVRQPIVQDGDGCLESARNYRLAKLYSTLKYQQYIKKT